MRKIIFLFIILNFLSCKKSTEEIIQYDKNGNILSKNYVSGGKSLDSIIYLNNGIIDTKVFFRKSSNTECYVKYYYKNGIVQSEGNRNIKKKIGKWKYYNSKGYIKKIVEFKNICNDEYPNQEWNYNDNGKLNENLCNYFTYKIGEPTIIDGIKGKNLKIYYSPMYKKKGVLCTINLSRKISKNFCNVDSVEKYHFTCDSTFIFNVPVKMEDLKKALYLKGYIEEHLFEDDIKDKSMVHHKTRRVYIDVPIREN